MVQKVDNAPKEQTNDEIVQPRLMRSSRTALSSSQRSYLPLTTKLEAQYFLKHHCILSLALQLRDKSVHLRLYNVLLKEKSTHVFVSCNQLCVCVLIDVL